MHQHGMDGGAVCIDPFSLSPSIIGPLILNSVVILYSCYSVALFIRVVSHMSSSWLLSLVSPSYGVCGMQGKINLHTTDTVRWDWASMKLVLQVAR
jgi:hypothetical protein